MRTYRGLSSSDDLSLLPKLRAASLLFAYQSFKLSGEMFFYSALCIPGSLYQMVVVQVQVLFVDRRMFSCTPPAKHLGRSQKVGNGMSMSGIPTPRDWPVC